MTQEQLAEASGVGRSHIAKIEAGEMDAPRRVTLNRLSKALSISEAQLAYSPTAEVMTEMLIRDPNTLDADLPALMRRIAEMLESSGKKSLKRAAAELARFTDDTDRSKFQLFEIPPEEFIVGEWDYPQTYRGGEADLMGGAAAGAFLDVDVTGETAELLNPTLRDVQSGRYGVVKIFGDSMEPRLHNGDLVLLDTFDKEYRPERIMAVYRRRSATERGGGAFGYVHKVGDLLIMTKANPRYGPIILTDQDIIRGVVKKRLSEDLE
jgi:phage repressor protein C with HTH and peptisase S24 domain/DNA-binding XRE family transcriptional regulator